MGFSDDFIPFLGLTLITGGFIIALFLLIRTKSSAESSKVDETEAVATAQTNGAKEKLTEKRSNAGSKEKMKAKIREEVVSNPLLIASLKGHKGEVMDLDFSANGKLLASCSEDRTVRLWSVKDFSEKEHKYSRDNIELDYAVSISFSPDSRAFITGLSSERTVKVSKVTKKKDGSGLAISQEFDFPDCGIKSDILSVGIASHGKYVMCAFKDTNIVLFDLKGEVLATIDTLQAYNSYAEVSPCGNLVGCCGFTPEVRLWHVEFGKDKGFKQVTRALELKGHSAGVYSFAYSNNSKRMASVSKDKTWKYWDTDVDYVKGQDSYLLGTGKYDHLLKNGQSCDRIVIGLAPDGFTVAIAINMTIGLFDPVTQTPHHVLEDVHSDVINCLRWHASSRQLASSGGGDRIIRIWNNPVGPRVLIEDLNQKISKVKTDSHKQRILDQIEDAKVYLKTIEAN